MEFDTLLFTLLGLPVTLGGLIWFMVALFGLMIGLLALTVVRMRRKTAEVEALAETEKAALNEQIKTMSASQTELTGRVQSMSEMLGHRQAELTRVMSERMERLGHRLGQSLAQQSHNTHETLTSLHERLAAIDSAQKNITELSQG
ncbi:MAG: DNA recombination protein RmuC, partial [Devosiaceae bacterium]|nr:DNA recombination protein RmuC [Devosiaceae bacterium MH13]